MFSIISVLVFTIPVLVMGKQLMQYLNGIYQARQFVVGQPIPHVFVYNTRGNILFWLLTPWFAPILEALPLRMGHWIRYIKKDFAWAHKGTLPLEELRSDI